MSSTGSTMRQAHLMKPARIVRINRKAQGINFEVKFEFQLTKVLLELAGHVDEVNIIAVSAILQENAIVDAPEQHVADLFVKFYISCEDANPAI